MPSKRLKRLRAKARRKKQPIVAGPGVSIPAYHSPTEQDMQNMQAMKQMPMNSMVSVPNNMGRMSHREMRRARLRGQMDPMQQQQQPQGGMGMNALTAMMMGGNSRMTQQELQMRQKEYNDQKAQYEKDKLDQKGIEALNKITKKHERLLAEVAKLKEEQTRYKETADAEDSIEKEKTSFKQTKEKREHERKIKRLENEQEDLELEEEHYERKSDLEDKLEEQKRRLQKDQKAKEYKREREKIGAEIAAADKMSNYLNSSLPKFLKRMERMFKQQFMLRDETEMKEKQEKMLNMQKETRELKGQNIELCRQLGIEHSKNPKVMRENAAKKKAELEAKGRNTNEVNALLNNLDHEERMIEQAHEDMVADVAKRLDVDEDVARALVKEENYQTLRHMVAAKRLEYDEQVRVNAALKQGDEDQEKATQLQIENNELYNKRIFIDPRTKKKHYQVTGHELKNQKDSYDINDVYAANADIRDALGDVKATHTLLEKMDDESREARDIISQNKVLLARHELGELATYEDVLAKHSEYQQCLTDLNRFNTALQMLEAYDDKNAQNLANVMGKLEAMGYKGYTIDQLRKKLADKTAEGKNIAKLQGAVDMLESYDDDNQQRKENLEKSLSDLHLPKNSTVKSLRTEIANAKKGLLDLAQREGMVKTIEQTRDKIEDRKAELQTHYTDLNLGDNPTTQQLRTAVAQRNKDDRDLAVNEALVGQLQSSHNEYLNRLANFNRNLRTLADNNVIKPPANGIIDEKFLRDSVADYHIQLKNAARMEAHCDDILDMYNGTKQKTSDYEAKVRQIIKDKEPDKVTEDDIIAARTKYSLERSEVEKMTAQIELAHKAWDDLNEAKIVRRGKYLQWRGDPPEGITNEQIDATIDNDDILKAKVANEEQTKLIQKDIDTIEAAKKAKDDEFKAQTTRDVKYEDLMKSEYGDQLQKMKDSGEIRTPEQLVAQHEIAKATIEETNKRMDKIAEDRAGLQIKLNTITLKGKRVCGEENFPELNTLKDLETHQRTITGLALDNRELNRKVDNTYSLVDKFEREEQFRIAINSRIIERMQQENSPFRKNYEQVNAVLNHDIDSLNPNDVTHMYNVVGAYEAHTRYKTDAIRDAFNNTVFNDKMANIGNTVARGLISNGDFLRVYDEDKNILNRQVPWMPHNTPLDYIGIPRSAQYIEEFPNFVQYMGTDSPDGKTLADIRGMGQEDVNPNIVKGAQHDEGIANWLQKHGF